MARRRHSPSHHPMSLPRPSGTSFLPQFDNHHHHWDRGALASCCTHLIAKGLLLPFAFTVQKRADIKTSASFAGSPLYALALPSPLRGSLRSLHFHCLLPCRGPITTKVRPHNMRIAGEQCITSEATLLQRLTIARATLSVRTNRPREEFFLL